ncbi:MAG: DUF3332 family protein, partial [Archangium sp.]|nr:DUF3332 family protein [Archangium sp.]
MMLSRRNLLVAAAVAGASSCYGQFALTRKLYGWNGSFENKFLSTLLMWVFMILPVYWVVGIADLLVFNLIEFWTDKNPLSTVTNPDGSQTRFARVDGDAVRVTRIVDGVEQGSFEVVMTGAQALMVRSVEGEVLATGEALADGALSLRGVNGAVTASAEQVREVEQS